MWKMDVRRVLWATHAHKKSTVFLRLVKLRDASHVVPVPNNQIVLKSRTVDQTTVELLSTWTNHKTSSFPTLLICSSTTFLLHPASIPKMLENINLAEELSRPVIPSDVHSGSLDPDPLPQDSKEHHFQTIKTSKNTPYKKWKYPIDELIGKSMFFYEVQRSGVLWKTTGYLGGVILPKQPFGDGEYGGDGLTLEITSSSDYR
jgi:hypothetical protein